MWQKLARAAAVTALALTLGATVAEAADRKTVLAAVDDDIKDWDPAIGFSYEVRLFRNAYETLVTYNRGSNTETISPGLALSWGKSEDGRTWTFRLRPNVSFHDGTKLTAAAAKASIERTIKLKQGAYFIWDGVEAIEAPDPLTLVFRLARPMPIDIIASSQYGAYIYSTAAAEKGTEWFNSGQAAGTGPYRVRRWAKDSELVLEKFPEYWAGWRDGQFENVVFKVVRESATQIQMLKSGEADFISSLPPDNIAGLRRDDTLRIQQFASWKNTQFIINTAKPPTDNLKIRQALAQALDYNAVAKGIYTDMAFVAEAPIPKTIWGFKPGLPMPKYDLAAARKLVEESGLAPGQRKLTLAYIASSEEYKNIAILLQTVGRQIGLEIELVPGPWGVIWDKQKKPETAANVISMTWWPTYPTPGDWLIGQYRTEKKPIFNLSYYANPAYDKLVDEGVALEGSDIEAATAKYFEAQRLLVADVPALFLVDRKAWIAHRADIDGVRYNPAYDAMAFYTLRRKG